MLFGLEFNMSNYIYSSKNNLTMKLNARAVASIVLSGGLIGVTASPVFANSAGTVQSDTFTSTNDDGSTSTFSSSSALMTGLKAPTIDVGSTAVEKGTVQYSNSTGTSDAFNVGTLSSISASVSASSTPDYNVGSTASFGIDASTINQVIGTSGAASSSSSQSSTETASIASSVAESQANSDFQQDVNNGGYWWWNRRRNKRTFVSNSDYESTKQTYTASLAEDITKSVSDASGQSGTISGVFKKTDGAVDGSSSNEVTVKGIGADNKIVAASDATFDTAITKVGVTPSSPGDPSLIVNTGAGTASGSASGSVNTTASANANSSQFVSSFAQAY